MWSAEGRATVGVGASDVAVIQLGAGGGDLEVLEL